MNRPIVCCLAALLAGAAATLPVPAAAQPGSATAQADGPKTANGTRAPEKKAEKPPKPRKSKKPARSGSAAP